MIISHRLEFVFFRVPKCGSTTMETILRMSNLFNDNDDCSPLDIFHVKAFGKGKQTIPDTLNPMDTQRSVIVPHMTPTEAIAAGYLTEEQLHSYTCRAALRDPLARYVSAFCHATAGKPLMNKEIFSSMTHAGKKLGLLHKPQHNYFKYKGEEVCTPIDFRDFQNAVNQMLDEIGQHPNAGPYLTFPVMPNFNRTRGKDATTTRAQYVDTDPSIEAKLRNDLAEDIELYESHYGTL